MFRTTTKLGQRESDYHNSIATESDRSYETKNIAYVIISHEGHLMNCQCQSACTNQRAR